MNKKFLNDTVINNLFDWLRTHHKTDDTDNLFDKINSIKSLYNCEVMAVVQALEIGVLRKLIRRLDIFYALPKEFLNIQRRVSVPLLSVINGRSVISHVHDLQGDYNLQVEAQIDPILVDMEDPISQIQDKLESQLKDDAIYVQSHIDDLHELLNNLDGGKEASRELLRISFDYHAELYEIIRSIESNLHLGVFCVLYESYGNLWFSNGIPKETRIKLARMYEENSPLVHENIERLVSGREINNDDLCKYHFTSFDHLREIISKNWPAFNPRLPKKFSDSKKLGDVLNFCNGIRNSVSHVRIPAFIEEEKYRQLSAIECDLGLGKWRKINVESQKASFAFLDVLIGVNWAGKVPIIVRDDGN
jgi:hypothetical protein